MSSQQTPAWLRLANKRRKTGATSSTPEGVATSSTPGGVAPGPQGQPSNTPPAPLTSVVHPSPSPGRGVSPSLQIGGVGRAVQGRGVTPSRGRAQPIGARQTGGRGRPDSSSGATGYFSGLITRSFARWYNAKVERLGERPILPDLMGALMANGFYFDRKADLETYEALQECERVAMSYAAICHVMTMARSDFDRHFDHLKLKQPEFAKFLLTHAPCAASEAELKGIKNEVARQKELVKLAESRAARAEQARDVMAEDIKIIRETRDQFEQHWGDEANLRSAAEKNLDMVRKEHAAMEKKYLQLEEKYNRDVQDLGARQSRIEVLEGALSETEQSLAQALAAKEEAIRDAQEMSDEIVNARRDAVNKLLNHLKSAHPTLVESLDALDIKSFATVPPVPNDVASPNVEVVQP